MGTGKSCVAKGSADSKAITWNWRKQSVRQAHTLFSVEFFTAHF